MASPDDVISKINKGQDKKDDMMLMISSQANWDQFLTPAPLAISLLGELILVSTKTDFSLTERPPTDGFKYLRHPDSFRACLVQVSNDGWSAFNEAHTNMDQIRLHSSNVEKHVKNAVKFLIGGSPDEVERMVPMSLNKVREIADSCLDLAIGMEDQFVNVIHVTGELLESCTAVTGTYEQRYKDTETALVMAKKQKEVVERSRDEMKERCAIFQKDIEEAHKDFKEAMTQIPTGARAVAYSLTGGVLNGINGAVKMLPNFSMIVNAATRREKVIVNTPTRQKNEADEIPNTCNEGMVQKSAKSLITWMLPSFIQPANDPTRAKACPSSTTSNGSLTQQTEKHKAYTYASIICPLVDELHMVATGNLRNGEQYPDLSDQSRDSVNSIKHILKSKEKRFAGLETDSSPKEIGLKICQKGVRICEMIEALFSISDDHNGAKGKSIVIEILDLKKTADEFNVNAKLKTGTNPLETKPPNTAKCHDQEPDSSDNLLESQTKAARFKTETAKEVFLDAQRRHDEAYKQMLAKNEQLAKIISDMAKLDIDKVDFDSIKQTLASGIKALADVREQWGQLVRFFQMMSNLIKCSLHTSLKDFIDYSKKGRELKLGHLPLSATFRDLIFNQATEANRVAYAVQVISKTYVEVSNNHLMDRVTKLNQLIAVDPSNAHEIQLKRNDLHNGTRAAQKAILSIMRRERQEFDERLEGRIRQIEREVEAVLPPLPAKEIEAIKKVVKGGIKQSEEDLEREADELV